MRINVYAEELPDERRCERVVVDTMAGRTYYGARLFLKSTGELPDESGDDNRSAVTFWGPRAKVVALLRELAGVMEREE